MRRILRHILPLSLRVRFLLATAAVVLVLSLSYGMVALVGTASALIKPPFACCAAKAICFIPWRNGKTTNHRRNAGKPESAKPHGGPDLQRKGKLLWAQRDVPWLVKSIRPEWLKTNGFHEIEADLNTTSSLIREDRSLQQKLNEIRADDAETEMTHSVAINLYPATIKCRS
jgi:two-component system sensor histidine kinase PhoQ